MEDRGEKIVRLARELLVCGASTGGFERLCLAASSTRRAVCLSAIISAIGASLVTQYIENSHRPISHGEMMEISLIAGSHGGDGREILSGMAREMGLNRDPGEWTARDYLRLKERVLRENSANQSMRKD